MDPAGGRQIGPVGADFVFVNLHPALVPRREVNEGRGRGPKQDKVDADRVDKVEDVDHAVALLDEEHPVLHGDEVDVDNLRNCPDFPVGKQRVQELLTGIKRGQVIGSLDFVNVRHLLCDVESHLVVLTLKPREQIKCQSEEHWGEESSVNEDSEKFNWVHHTHTLFMAYLRMLLVTPGLGKSLSSVRYR